MAARRQSERGSAMVEAAIIFPCLVLILYWSAALTDVMVLKLKAAEALRYSLWEMTVFKPPAQINNEVQQRFVDLRSPKSINISYTGLLMYPLARDMAWKATVDNTTNTGGLGGNKVPPQGNGFLDRLLGLVQNALASAVDANLRLWKFNLKGEKRSLEFRWETFNSFNHTQFSAVGTTANFAADGTQTNTTFGKVTSAKDGRKMMFGLRFAF